MEISTVTKMLRLTIQYYWNVPKRDMLKLLFPNEREEYLQSKENLHFEQFFLSLDPEKQKQFVDLAAQYYA